MFMKILLWQFGWIIGGIAAQITGDNTYLLLGLISLLGFVGTLFYDYLKPIKKEEVKH